LSKPYKYFYLLKDKESELFKQISLIAQISGGTKNGKLKVFLNYSGFAGSD